MGGEPETAFASVARLNLRHAVDGPLGMDEASRIRERNAGKMSLQATDDRTQLELRFSPQTTARDL
jgi:hypothetical protein